MIAANKDVIDQVRALTWTVDFYESITGEMDLAALLDKGARQVRKFVKASNVSIFLTNSNGFELHMGDDSPIEVDDSNIERFFNDEVVNEISRSNNICTLDDMCNIGLQGNPNVLNNVSAAAIPIGWFAEPVGFILIYRSADRKLRAEELEKAATIMPGLRNAIKACQTMAPQAAGK
jgi:hypothetical protein